MKILTVVCVATMLLALPTFANHVHGSNGIYHHHRDHVSPGQGEFDIKAHKGDTTTGSLLENNNNDDFGFDRFSQKSSKDAAAGKQSKAASANRNHDKKLEKEQENKAASKNAHDKAAASASAHKKEKSAEASKRHAKKYSRAKKIDIYSKKASDITKSYEDNSASAKSLSKDSAAKKTAAKDRGSNAALRSNERELKFSDKGTSNAASNEQSSGARVKSNADRNENSGHKKSSSSKIQGHLQRAGPSSFTKLAVHKSYGLYGLGSQQPGSSGLYHAYPSSGMSTSHAYNIAGGKSTTSLPSNLNGIESRSIPGHPNVVGVTSSSSIQNYPYRKYHGINLGSSSGIYGTAGQPLGSNTFGIGGGFLRQYDRSMSNVGNDISSGSMSYTGHGASLGSLSNIGSTSQSSPMNDGIHQHTSRLYVRPAAEAGESGLPLEKVGRPQPSNAYPHAYGRQAITARLEDHGSFASFDSNFFKGFEDAIDDDDDDDDDDDNLLNFDYGSSGFNRMW